MWNINFPGSVDLNNLQATPDLESPVRLVPLPEKYYEKRFLDKIGVVGNFKVKGEVSYDEMPFYKIKLTCKTKRFTYETIVIGDECEEEGDARENAFRKAYDVIMKQYRWDFEDHEKMLKRKKLMDNYASKNKLVDDENVNLKPVPIQPASVPLPEGEYEGKFRAIIKPVGSYKIESDLTQKSMPFFKIWLHCKTNTFNYETTVVGGECVDENEAREEAYRKAYWVLQNQFQIEEENSTRGGYSSKTVQTRAPLQENVNFNLQSGETKPSNKVFESKFKSMMESVDGTYQLEPNVNGSPMPSFKLNMQCNTGTMKYDAVIVGYNKPCEAAARESVFQQVKKYFYEQENVNVPVSVLENRNRPNRKYFEGHFTSFISDLGTFTLESKPSYFKIHLECHANRVTLKTTVIGDKFAEEEFARQNVYRKAYYLLKEKFQKEWGEYQKKLRQFE